MAQHQRIIHVWAGTLLLLWAAALGIMRLDDTAVWMDEYLSIYDIGGMDDALLSPAGVWERIATRNPYHAPGYFILLGGWARAVGTEPAALRTFSLLAGVLALAVAYRIGRDVVAPQVGLYALVVLGVSTFYQHYLHELRMYSLMALFAALALWGYLLLLRGDYRANALVWGSFAVGLVGSLYTHYFSALLALAIGMYHLLFAPKRRGWGYTLAVMLGALLLFLPWVGALLAGLQETFGDSQLREKALPLTASLGWLANGLSNGSTILFAAAGGLAILAVLRPRWGKLERRGVWQLAFFALGTSMLLLAANEVVGMMHSRRLRYFMVAWVPLSLLLAIGIYSARNLPLRGASVVLAAAWLVFGTVQVLSGQHQVRHDGASDILPTHVIARDLMPHVQAEDFIYVFPPDNQSSWRYHFVSDLYLGGVGAGYYVVNTNPENSAPDDADDLYADMGDRARVWVAHMPSAAPTAHAPFVSNMQQYHMHCHTVEDNGVSLALYSKTPYCCTPLQANDPLAVYQAGISLQEQHISQDDGALSVTLGWVHGTSTPYEQFSVGIYLLDEDQQVMAQADYGLSAYQTNCETTALDVAALPAGAYSIHTTVYNWQTGERLPRRDAPDPLVRVGQVVLP